MTVSEGEVANVTERRVRALRTNPPADPAVDQILNNPIEYRHDSYRRIGFALPQQSDCQAAGIEES